MAGTKGEFENRDRDEGSDLSGIPLAGSLGELPEDLSSERGDLDTYALRAAEQMAPDMASAQRGRVDAALTGVGSPRIDYSVRSIYDSRPINHKEFNLWFARVIQEGGSEADFSWARRCFYVPAGYVCVLREFKAIIPPNATPVSYDGTVQFLVNGSVVDPTDVEEGPEVDGVSPSQVAIPIRDDEPVTTFIIADEGASVGVELTIVNAIPSADTDFFRIGFYGQFLLKTGVPAQFQPANEAGRARTAVTSSAADFRNIASSEGVTVTKRKRVPFPNVPILRK